MTKPKIAIFPGTFDPPHSGHMDVLAQAAQTFDLVVWAILPNPDKQPRFDLETRIAMMRGSASNFPNVRAAAFEGLLVKAAQSITATHIVRSLRVGMDFDFEFPMTLVNRKLAPELITVYFPARQEHFHISSTMVRQLIDFGEDVSEYVPAAVIRRLKEYKNSG